MAAYTLRIELLGSPSQDVYKNLHARMAAEGFLQTVTGVNSNGTSVTCNLPHATYFGSSGATATQVRDWSQAQAKAVWGSNTVFVAETSSWAAG